MKTAYPAIDRSRMRGDVGAPLTLTGRNPDEPGSGAPARAAAKIRRRKPDRGAKNTSKRITAVDNVMTQV
jgi:hypothetical protein